ncbi:Cytochrome P450 4V2 [Balamuthia mandrillaris]
MWLLLYLVAAVAAVALGLVGAAFIYLLWVNKTTFDATDIPQPPRHWILGHIPNLVEHPKDSKYPLFDAGFAALARQYGSTYCLDLPIPNPKRMIVTEDIQIVKQKLREDPPKDDYSLEPLLRHGLVTTNGAVWQHDRKVINPAFHKKFLSALFPVMTKHCQTLIDDLLSLRPYEKVEMHQKLQLLTLDVIGEAILDRNFRFQESPDHPLRVVMQNVFQEIAARDIDPFRSWTHPWTTWKYNKEISRWNDLCKKYLEEARVGLLRKQQQQGSTKVEGEEGLQADTIVQVMLDGSLTEHSLIDNIKTFFFAGHDTTATLLSGSVAMLSQHPHIQEKLQQEVDRVLGERNVPTKDDIPELKYLKMVLKETLRMYPPASTSRKLRAGEKVGPYTLTKDTAFLVSAYVIHHCPKYWPDPEVFDPERFSPENSKNRDPYTFLPFLAGPRNCIGQHLAMLEATALLCMLMKRFSFRMAYNQIYQLKYQMTNVPSHGVWVFALPRELLQHEREQAADLQKE